MGFNCDGGFAQLLALPEQSLSGGVNLLPHGAEPVLAALAEPLACCINGQEQARVSEGDCVLIYGGGPIGALHALLAELHRAEKIIVAERLPGRIRLLERHTSATVVNTAEESGKNVLAEEIGKEGVGMGGASLLAGLYGVTQKQLVEETDRVLMTVELPKK